MSRWLRLLVVGSMLASTVSPAFANRLQRSAAAAFEGANGLESIYEGNRQKSFVVRELRTSEDRIYMSFVIQPGANLDIIRGKLNDLLHLRQSGRKKPIVQASLRDTNDGLRMQFRVLDGAKRPRLVKKVNNRLLLPVGEWTAVTIDWIAASGQGLDDGSITVWKNRKSEGDEPFARKIELDNDDHLIEEIRVGQVSTTKTGWFGSVYLDQLLIRRRP